jgi:hypothetical protein
MKNKFRFYAYLRSIGYTPQQAIWNVRACSNLFWQRMLVEIRTQRACTA